MHPQTYAIRRPGRPLVPIEDRLLSAVTAGPNGCWLWTQRVNNHGYGRLSTGSRKTLKLHLAHRVSYETFVGPIPDGKVIDHLCRTRRCIRPDHLEPVAQQQNVLRSPIAVAARWAARTHCNNGHEFTPENTHIRYRRGRPYRVCRPCDINKKRAQREAAAR